MAQTKLGAIKAMQTIKAKNPNHWREIGAIGGSRSTPEGGFGSKLSCVCKDIEGAHRKAQCAGRRGGLTRGYNQRKKVAA